MDSRRRLPPRIALRGRIDVRSGGRVVGCLVLLRHSSHSSSACASVQLAWSVGRSPSANALRNLVRSALASVILCFPVDFSFHLPSGDRDRKSTRLNSSHLGISYAVFCL